MAVPAPDNDKHWWIIDLSSRKAISTVVFIFISVVTTTTAINRTIYIERIATLENIVESYEKSEDWKLPEILEQIGVASGELQLNVDEQRRLQLSEERVAELENVNATLQNELTNLDNENALLQERVASLEADLTTFLTELEIFELQEGESKAMLGNVYQIGLHSVYSNYVTVNINNTRTDLSVGNQHIIEDTGRSCSLRLIQIKDSENTAAFSFGCEE